MISYKNKLNWPDSEIVSLSYLTKVCSLTRLRFYKWRRGFEWLFPKFVYDRALIFIFKAIIIDKNSLNYLILVYRASLHIKNI